MLKTVVLRCQVSTVKKDYFGTGDINLFNPRYHCLGFRSVRADYGMSEHDGEDLILH